VTVPVQVAVREAILIVVGRSVPDIGGFILTITWASQVPRKVSTGLRARASA
jgi:hypothetical protein